MLLPQRKENTRDVSINSSNGEGDSGVQLHHAVHEAHDGTFHVRACFRAALVKMWVRQRRSACKAHANSTGKQLQQWWQRKHRAWGDKRDSHGSVEEYAPWRQM